MNSDIYSTHNSFILSLIKYFISFKFSKLLAPKENKKMRRGLYS